MGTNDDDGTALEHGINFLALLFGEKEAKPRVVQGRPHPNAPAGKRPCNCTGRRVEGVPSLLPKK